MSTLFKEGNTTGSAPRVLFVKLQENARSQYDKSILNVGGSL